MAEYQEVNNPESRLMICRGETWDEEGGMNTIQEVSDFDASECLMFSPKEMK
jgi:hypothetical protein